MVYLIAVCYMVFFVCSPAVPLDKPISIDSRIRTLVYSPNEVFRVVVHYGYQTNIEFANGEEVQTILVGNSYAWQLSPLSNRLFIKPLEENILTNMTLITNKRTYQFELQSKDLMGFTDDELVYVMRFFYPDDSVDVVSQDTYVASMVAAEEQVPAVQPYNFNYKVSGPVLLAPTKVFDDGISTYFKFLQSMKEVPEIEAKVGDKMKKISLKNRGEYVVAAIANTHFIITSKNQRVEVINNALN